MPLDYFVLSVEVADGERFAIVKPEDMLRSGRSLGTEKDWSTALQHWIRSLELLTEGEIRSRLEALGLDQPAVSAQILKARRSRHLNRGASWERVTTIGYRNVEGQVVLAKTSHIGADASQRVYRMRCTVCGHEYGTLGPEIPDRCCPACQDGAAGEKVSGDES